jgi:hypothetical protein
MGDNIQMKLKETGFEEVDQALVAQDRVELWALLNVVMNLQVP